jgi:hypothetical protein
VVERLEGYRANRKRGLADLTAELQQRLQSLILPSGFGMLAQESPEK